MTTTIETFVKYDKVLFISDDFVENEIAIRFFYEWGHTRRVLVVDEAHIYGESRQLQKALRYAGHKNMDIVLISHSFFDFARIHRHLIHNIVIFQITEPYELSYIRRIDARIKPDKLRLHEFTILQGDIPIWLDRENVKIENGGKLVLRIPRDEKPS